MSMIFVPDVKLGDKFGRLTFLKMGKRSAKFRQWYWMCKCDCGNEIEALGCNVKHGKTNSCGCLQKERASEAKTIHGQSGKRVHSIWKNMKQRCFNPKHKHFPSYGGRGIVMCDAWKNDFAAFFSDVGSPPTDGHSLDRIDNNKGYFPENVKWETVAAQNLNRRNTIEVNFSGIRTLKELCDKEGLNYFKAYDMIVRKNIPVATAVNLLKNSKIAPK